MVRARNPVYSAMGLMLTMFSMAVFYVSNAAHFVAAVQVIIYAGAVMTLFLFVIMLIGVDKAEDSTEQIPFQRPVALGPWSGARRAGVRRGRAPWVTGFGSGEAQIGTIETIADELFSTWLLPFEATVLLLTIAAVGTIALAQFEGRRLSASERRCGHRRKVLSKPTPKPWRGASSESHRGWYMALAAVLFAIGAAGLLLRRNALVMFMSVELMLNAVNLTFVAAGRELGILDGQVSVLFVMVVAAAEVTVGLAIIVSVFRRRATATVDELAELKG